MQDGIKLELLPEFTAIKQTPIQDIIDDLAKRAALENAAPSDPSYRTMLAQAYREKMLRQDIDEQTKGVMLAFAKGPQLDHIGSTYYRTPDGKPVKRLVGETDEAYQSRLQLSMEGYSSAGPDGAYRFYTKSADPNVRDCEPTSPLPCHIENYILTYDNGGQATEALCKKVEAFVFPHRPLGDRHRVHPAEILSYTVDAELIVRKGLDNAAIKQKALEQVMAFTLDEHKLAGYVSSSSLDKHLTTSGVVKVNLIGWQDVVADRTQAPRCDGVSITVKELA
ncbi:baseplate J/gp47 family protein [Vibrio cholerae]|nr:baseplate J/gp47 family protein [Vibrio cholerae]